MPGAATSTKNRAVLPVMCIALATVVSAVASLNVALPELARATHADQTDLQWIVDAYALTFAALLLPAGALGDRYGRRLMLYLGLGIFGIVSLAATFMSDPRALIAARAVLGVGAALVMPATLAIITTLTPKDGRDRAVALWAAVAGASAILGLLTAGLLLEAFSWSSIFGLNAVLAGVSIGATARWVPESVDPTKERLDWPAALLSAAGLAAIVYGIIEAPVHGWTGARTLGTVTFGLLALVVFCWWELRQRAPMVDVRMFARGRFAAGTLSIAVQFFCFFGFVFMVLQQFQLVRGMSPLVAAVAMVPMAIALMATSRRAPKVTARVGARATATAGLLLMALGLGVLESAGGDSPYWLVGLGLIPLGAGMALATTTATTAILDGLPPEKQGVGSAMNDTAREVGGALGIAVLGSLLSQGYRSGMEAVPGSLPPQARHAVTESLGAALQVSDRFQLPSLAGIAQDAFMDGFSTAMWTAVVTLAAGAVIVNRLLAKPAAVESARKAQAPVAGPPDAAARA